MQLRRPCTAGPPSHQTPHPRKQLAWWRQPSVVIPIAISLVAVGFTGGTYWDQHQADARQMSAAQESNALLVSFWPTGEDYTGEDLVVVQSLAQEPIYNADLDLEIAIQLRRINSQGIKREVLRWVIPLGIVPPCPETKVDVSEKALVVAAAVGYFGTTAIASAQPFLFPELLRTWDTRAVSLQFADSNGLRWYRSFTGLLARGDPKGYKPPLYGGAPGFVAAEGGLASRATPPRACA